MQNFLNSLIKPLTTSKWTLLAACSLIISLGYVITLTVFSSYWTWELYDEISWYNFYKNTDSIYQWIRFDFWEHGRFRPFTPLFNFSFFKICLSDPHYLKIGRVIQFIIFLITTLWLLISKNKIKPLFALTGLGFIIKSPPQLEQLHWVSLSELYGELLLAAALAAYSRSRPLAYLCLIVAAFTKEPLALFLALPALLSKQYREAFVTTVVTTIYFLVLWFNRSHYSSNYLSAPMAWSTLENILKGSFMDFLPVLLVMIPTLLMTPMRLGSHYKSFLYFGFGVAYSLLVLPMALGYTYIQAPATFAMGCGFAFFLQELQQTGQRRTLKYLWMPAVIAMALVFPLRLIWNWTKVHETSHLRLQAAQTLRTLPQPGTVSTNCTFDAGALGFISGTRQDITDCYYFDSDIKKCCNKAAYITVGTSCPRATELTQLAMTAQLPRVFENKGWRIFECKKN